MNIAQLIDRLFQLKEDVGDDVEIVIFNRDSRAQFSRLEPAQLTVIDVSLADQGSKKALVIG